MEIKLLEIRTDKFIYCGENYIQYRYITEDMKFYITNDKMDNIRVYTKSPTSKVPDLVYDIYHENNPYAYPITSLDEAVKRLYTTMLEVKETFEVHPSQFNGKSLIININK